MRADVSGKVGEGEEATSESLRNGTALRYHSRGQKYNTWSTPHPVSLNMQKIVLKADRRRILNFSYFDNAEGLLLFEKYKFALCSASVELGVGSGCCNSCAPPCRTSSYGSLSFFFLYSVVGLFWDNINIREWSSFILTCDTAASYDPEICLSKQWSKTKKC